MPPAWGPEEIILLHQLDRTPKRIAPVHHVGCRHARRPTSLNALLQHSLQPPDKRLLGFPHRQMQRTRLPLPAKNLLHEGRGKRANASAQVQQPHIPFSRVEHTRQQARHSRRGQKLAHPAPVPGFQRGTCLLAQARGQRRR